MSNVLECESSGGEGSNIEIRADGSKTWKLSDVQFLRRDTKKPIYELVNMVVNILSDGVNCSVYITFDSKPLGFRIKIPAQPASISLTLLQRNSSDYNRVADDLGMGTVYLDCIPRHHSFNKSINPLLFPIIDKVDFVRTTAAFNPC